MQKVTFKSPVTFTQQGVAQTATFIECHAVMRVNDWLLIWTSHDDCFTIEQWKCLSW